MVNWGVEVEDDSGEAIEETPCVSDWVIRKQATPAIKDWLLQPTVSKPWTKTLCQTTLNIQRMNTFQTAGNGNQQVPPLDPALTDGGKPEEPVRSIIEESPKTITVSRMGK